MLLDTHVWRWGANDTAGRLGPRTRRLLDRIGAGGQLYLSTVSIFELTALHLAGRVQLTLPIETWIRESIERNALRVSNVTGLIAIDAGAIPVTALADPFDRLVVASARQLDVPLVTRDERILAYARTTGQVDVVDASK